jgi:hypothetical protein
MKTREINIHHYIRKELLILSVFDLIATLLTIVIINMEIIPLERRVNIFMCYMVIQILLAISYMFILSIGEIKNE